MAAMGNRKQTCQGVGGSVKATGDGAVRETATKVTLEGATPKAITSASERGEERARDEQDKGEGREAKRARSVRSCFFPTPSELKPTRLQEDVLEKGTVRAQLTVAP